MSNPLYNAMAGAGQNNITGFMRQLNQLKSTFKGDPNQQIQQLLNSHRVTQEDYNRAVQQAQQIMKLLGR